MSPRGALGNVYLLLDRRRFFTLLSSLPLLGWLRPVDKPPLMEVKPDPRLVDPNDYYILKPGNNIPTTLIVRPDQEAKARELVGLSEYDRNRPKISYEPAPEWLEYRNLTKREKLAKVDPYWYLYE